MSFFLQSDYVDRQDARGESVHDRLFRVPERSFIATGRVLALTLIGSCMVNVFLTAGQLVMGRGVKVEGVKAESPLAKAVFHTRTVTQATPIRSGDIDLGGGWETHWKSG